MKWLARRHIQVSRRAAVGAAVSAALVALAGCETPPTTSPTTTPTTVAVTLAGAQAEAQAILASLTAFAASIGPTLGAADQPKLSKALASLTAAVGNFVGVPAGANFQQYAQAVINTAMTVVAIIPLPPTTSIAITAGLALVSGLIAGLSAVKVNVPTTTTPAAPAAMSPGRVAAPIPIPMS